MSTRERRASRVVGFTHCALQAFGQCSSAELTRLMRSDPELLVQVPRLARAEVERALRELVRTRNALRVMVQGEPARFRLRNVGPGYDAHWGRRNLLHVKGGE